MEKRTKIIFDILEGLLFVLASIWFYQFFNWILSEIGNNFQWGLKYFPAYAGCIIPILLLLCLHLYRHPTSFSMQKRTLIGFGLSFLFAFISLLFNSTDIAYLV